MEETEPFVPYLAASLCGLPGPHAGKCSDSEHLPRGPSSSCGTFVWVPLQTRWVSPARTLASARRGREHILGVGGLLAEVGRPPKG